MFTGIVESTGIIDGLAPSAAGCRLRVDLGPIAAHCKAGDSVCLGGACLTVAAILNGSVVFDIVPETLRATTLGTKRIGDRLNVERSLRVGDRLDGHFVQGHVDGVATVDEVARSGLGHSVWLRPPRALLPYIVPKGSIAIDGASLTIAAVTGGSFSVALIPTTLERTTLSQLRPGDSVNIETDIIARTVVHLVSSLPTDRGLSSGVPRETGVQ